MPIEIILDKIANTRIEEVEDLLVEWFVDRLDERLTPVGKAFKVHFTAEQYTNVVSVRGKVTGAVTCLCARCGDDIEWPVEIDFVHRYVSKGDLHKDQMTQESAEEIELDVSEHDGAMVDIAPIVIEQMVVELPFAPTCLPGMKSGCTELGDEPLEFGDTEPLVREETSWSKALKGVDKSKLKGS
jgi:uncharacterized metal-binding protein YceD (DUF177 family)